MIKTSVYKIMQNFKNICDVTIGLAFSVTSLIAYFKIPFC